MDTELEKLKRDYRAITAPPQLATRIKAHIEQSRRHRWMPVAVACTAILAVLWMLPTADDSARAPDTETLRPSLSTLAALKPAKPATASPSLSNIRSVSVPSMPSKPPTLPARETSHQLDNRTVKEKDDAHI